MSKNKKTQTKQFSDFEMFARLMKYASPYTLTFILILFVMLITIILNLLTPIFVAYAIDILAGQSSSPWLVRLIERFVSEKEVNVLITLSILSGTSVIISGGLNYLYDIQLKKTSQKIVYKIRQDVFDHVHTLSTDFFNKNPIGRIVTRVTNDTTTLNEMYTSVVVYSIRSFTMIVAVMVFLFVLNAELALYVTLITPLVAIASFIFRKVSRPIFRKVRGNLSRINAFLAEHLSGMQTIQIFNQEQAKYEQFDVLNNKLKKSYVKQLIAFTIYRPSIFFLYMCATIVVFWFGGNQVIAGTMTIGLVFSFYLYVNRFFGPIQELAEQFNVLQSAFASSERIFALLDEVPTIVDKEDALELDINGTIEFKNVWFAYKEDDWILKDVSFKIKAGESAAFVGATGAGKTTILALITRNYDIQEGEILIDGVSVYDIKKDNLRRQVGQMMQNVFLFEGTIADNIKMREEFILDDEMKQACKFVGASRFIEKLPDKYDEVIRERGNNFSVGERQLLSFARTIAHKPKVMILDEATANIDTENEQIIQESLLKMMSRGTMLVVAHRLSTIQHSDKIIVMDKGEIKEMGNHQELLAKKGMYHELYKLQFSEE